MKPIAKDGEEKHQACVDDIVQHLRSANYLVYPLHPHTGNETTFSVEIERQRKSGEYEAKTLEIDIPDDLLERAKNMERH